MPASGPAAAGFRVAGNPHHAHRWIILGIVGIAQLMVILDSTIVNIALPSAQHALHFSDNDRQWVVTAYALAFGSLLPLGGRLSDLIGRKTAFLAGLAGFAGASAAGGAASGFAVLVTARTVQGAFGALLAPSVLALLSATFTDPAERNRAFAVYGGLAGAGGAVGLILGGVLTSYESWRWTLYVNVVFAAVAVAGALRFLDRDRGSAAHVDIPGAIAVSAGLFAAVYGFSRAATAGWASALTFAWLAAGVVLLVAFFIRQRFAAHPLVPLRIIADRSRGGVLIAVFATSAALFGVFLFLTYYLQAARGYSPLRTGLAFLPMIGGLVLAGSAGTTRLLPRYGPRPVVPAGMVTAAGGLVMLSRLGLHSGYPSFLLPALVITGAGLGLVFGPSFTMATYGVRPGDTGAASALVNTTQQVGGSLGVALLNTVDLSAVSAYLIAHPAGAGDRAVAALAALHGYTTAFLWGAVIFGAGAVLSAAFLRPGPPTGSPEAVPATAAGPLAAGPGSGHAS